MLSTSFRSGIGISEYERSHDATIYLTEYTRSGYNLLQIACATGHLRLVNHVLNLGLDVNTSTVGCGMTPLMIATVSGYWTIAALLIKKGANLEVSMSPLSSSTS